MYNNKTDVISLDVVSAALTSVHAYALGVDVSTHDHTLRLVGQLVRHTENVELICNVVRGRLPESYSGNSLDEVPRMVRDCLDKGFGKNGSDLSEKKGPASGVALSLVTGDWLEFFHNPQGVSYAALRHPGGGEVCFAVYSDAFKSLIRRMYFEATGKTISREAMAETVDLIHAQARYE